MHPLKRPRNRLKNRISVCFYSLFEPARLLHRKLYTGNVTSDNRHFSVCGHFMGKLPCAIELGFLLEWDLRSWSKSRTFDTPNKWHLSESFEKHRSQLKRKLCSQRFHRFALSRGL